MNSINEFQLKKLQIEINKLIEKLTLKNDEEIKKLKYENLYLKAENIKLKSLIYNDSNSVYSKLIKNKKNINLN